MGQHCSTIPDGCKDQRPFSEHAGEVGKNQQQAWILAWTLGISCKDSWWPNFEFVNLLNEMKVKADDELTLVSAGGKPRCKQGERRWLKLRKRLSVLKEMDCRLWKLMKSLGSHLWDCAKKFDTFKDYACRFSYAWKVTYMRNIEFVCGFIDRRHKISFVSFWKSVTKGQDFKRGGGGGIPQGKSNHS